MEDLKHEKVHACSKELKFQEFEFWFLQIFTAQITSDRTKVNRFEKLSVRWSRCSWKSNFWYHLRREIQI